ncbi:CLUMA_CG000197, isoform A [Clunio marinus]|uniref:Serum response factor homolog n=1 Tax=Clunio marinus TaxID=568069 RepID=A0A1J1HE00_9DIPT|nr:CLUMA_CG000197, isoform A [Clunio marinus]
MELEAERISPTLNSRYLNTYITNPTDIYHQNYHSPRQNTQSFYSALETDRNYLKRHYYVKDDENDERERKYEKLVDQQVYPHPYQTNEIYDSYNNNTMYPEVPQERSATDDSNSIVLTNNNSNDNYPINSSPTTSIEDTSDKITDSPKSVASGKKTKGRVKIKMEYIENKLRRYTTFSKRKTGIMKKAYELSTLTGTQVMLLVASETGHVYTFATRKLQPMITSDAGKQLIQTCLNSPESGETSSNNPVVVNEQRMSATGFEETELSFDICNELNDLPEKQKFLFPIDFDLSDFL